MRKHPRHGTTTPAGQIKTLGDYIVKVEKHEEQLAKKKLTFDEWAREVRLGYKLDNGRDLGSWSSEEAFKRCWKAAQENK